MLRKRGWDYRILILALAVFYAGFAAGNEAAIDADDANGFIVSVSDVLTNETKALEHIKQQLSEAETLQTKIQTGISAYKFQQTLLKNLLMNPATSVKDLESAWIDIDKTVGHLSERITYLISRQETVTDTLKQTEKQAALIGEQSIEVLVDNVSVAAEKQRQKLARVIEEKQVLYKKLKTVYTETIGLVKEQKQVFSNLHDTFAKQIRERNRKALLERQSSLISISTQQIILDFKQLFSLFHDVVTSDFWIKQLEFVRGIGSFYRITLGVLAVIVLIMIYHVKQFIAKIRKTPQLAMRFWNRLVLKMVQKSLLLSCVTLFIYFFLRIGSFYSNFQIIWAALNICLIWLFTQWAKDAFRMMCESKNIARVSKAWVSFQLLIALIRMGGVGYVVLSWLGTSETVLVVWRLLMDVSLYIGSLMFWATLQRVVFTDITNSPSRQKSLFRMMKTGVSIVLIAALIFELAGYGRLSVYWLTSWGITAGVILWSFLLVAALRQWHYPVEVVEDPADEMADMHKKSIRWVLVQFGLMVWFFGFVYAIVLAWGGRHSVLIAIWEFLKQSYQVGTMQFSLLGFILAVVVLLMTQAVSRLWQHLFRETILTQSGMEEGVKDSVVTITVYAVWSVGIIFALTVFGFNATSLTVVMGALGIGLGFGLQAIFNNFISGLILLFERPFQVGDDIEVNGTWAQVRKINVRSTLVQTYDNATLIIPNSDFISSQVTNWSFKDKRIRRKVEVGVAYGSDTALVNSILLDVARNAPNVLKAPAPDVIFLDFGDSALIFRLRFWTKIQWVFSTETAVRFGIDKAFRDNGIVIAFPQLDVHYISDEKKRGDNQGPGDLPEKEKDEQKDEKPLQTV